MGPCQGRREDHLWTPLSSPSLGRHKPLRGNECRLDGTPGCWLWQRQTPLRFCCCLQARPPEKRPGLKPAEPLKPDARRDDSVGPARILTSFRVSLSCLATAEVWIAGFRGPAGNCDIFVGSSHAFAWRPSRACSCHGYFRMLTEVLTILCVNRVMSVSEMS